jgi:hypothetical protein
MTTSSRHANIFIPHMKSYISKQKIKYTFKEMGIGNVFYLDLRRRGGKNNNVYSFAFIQVELFNNENADTIMSNIDATGRHPLHYDGDKNYWELKSYIARESRSSKSKETNEIPDTIVHVTPVEIPKTFEDEVNVDEDIKELCDKILKSSLMMKSQFEKKEKNMIQTSHVSLLDRLDMKFDFENIEDELDFIRCYTNRRYYATLIPNKSSNEYSMF